MYPWIMGIVSWIFVIRFVWILFKNRHYAKSDLALMGFGVGMIAFCGIFFIYLAIKGI
ncbi:hypothetical protein BN3662_01604 [Clostridiales bacterium CHKCI006]|nr:hypothetical protein BN3662_01604 [Clostridiales bacterium CHKCI006]